MAGSDATISPATHFDHIAGTPQGKATTLAAKYEYAMSKRTFLYGSYAHVTNNANAALGIYAATANFQPSGLGQDPSILSVGIRHAY